VERTGQRPNRSDGMHTRPCCERGDSRTAIPDAGTSLGGRRASRPTLLRASRGVDGEGCVPGDASASAARPLFARDRTTHDARQVFRLGAVPNRLPTNRDGLNTRGLSQWPAPDRVRAEGASTFGHEARPSPGFGVSAPHGGASAVDLSGGLAADRRTTLPFSARRRWKRAAGTEVIRTIS